MDGASIPGDGATNEERDRAQKFRETLGDRVRILVDGLTPELEDVYMLERWSSMSTYWAAWEVKREATEGGTRTICNAVDVRNVP